LPFPYFCTSTNLADTSLQQYNSISRLNRPRDSDVKKLREWIESPHLGGGCGFIGRDLGGFVQESVYDPQHAGDFVIPVQNYGEGDFLSQFLSGPFLKLFHRLWYRHKVHIKIQSPNNFLRSADRFNRHLLHSILKANQDLVIRAHYTITPTNTYIRQSPSLALSSPHWHLWFPSLCYMWSITLTLDSDLFVPLLSYFL